jgi:hypothetical protein
VAFVFESVFAHLLLRTPTTTSTTTLPRRPPTAQELERIAKYARVGGASPPSRQAANLDVNEGDTS